MGALLRHRVKLNFGDRMRMIRRKFMKNLHKKLDNLPISNHDLAEELRVALMTQQLHVVFQPKICAQTHRTVGAEVLLRWQHPVEGLISADRWVSIAESHNLMRPLTVWLVDSVVAHLKNSGETALPLAINVSPTIMDGKFALYIVKTLNAAKVAPHLLEIEITESAPVPNMTNLANAVRLLQTKGLKVYLDDFGTGYSTMQYLVDVPVDGVKMDKSFVQQAPLVPAARLILRSLIELANEIGVTVICEGVETFDQLSLVKRLGAQIIQGYLTGKPMSAEAYAKHIDAPQIPLLPDVEPELYKVHAS
jgi:EAL domain-containing protein (putative c-di-GMP-specific phosphodiesterase class I)